MKTFEITIHGLRDVTYTVTPCTAIPLCYDEDEDARVNALLVRWDDGIEHDAKIVFCDWPMPETAADFEAMCEDSSAWETLQPEHHMIEAED